PWSRPGAPGGGESLGRRPRGNGPPAGRKRTPPGLAPPLPRRNLEPQPFPPPPRSRRQSPTFDSGPQKRQHRSTTAEVYVNQTSVPLSVAVFTCACGARRIQYDLKRNSPSGWSTAADGSDRCPRCAGREIAATALPEPDVDKHP